MKPTAQRVCNAIMLLLAGLVIVQMVFLAVTGFYGAKIDASEAIIHTNAGFLLGLHFGRRWLKEGE